MQPFPRRVRKLKLPDSEEDGEPGLPPIDKASGSNSIALIQNLRSLVKSYMDAHVYESALFWADKVVSLSYGEPIDVFWLAQAMYHVKQYHRAAYCIQSRGLHKVYLRCRYLAAKCLTEAKDYSGALTLLTPEVNVENPPFQSDGSRCPAVWGGENKRLASSKVLFTERVDSVSKKKRASSGEPPITVTCCSTSQDPHSPTATCLADVVDTNLLPDVPSKRSNQSFNLCKSDSKFNGLDTSDSAILFLKGCVYEALDNRSLAAHCFKNALIKNVFCYGALEALVQHQMLAASEEIELIRSLPLSKQCKTEAEKTLVLNTYESLLKKYHCVPAETSVKIHSRLEENLDLEVATAERNYYACAFLDCYRMTTKILLKDPYHIACLPIHVACLVELKKGNDLFQLAHKLLDLRPDLAMSWFAVGCYHYLKGKTHPARRYLDKATTLDKLFGPAWLAYGHTFAVENEHDQAMAAYFKASQLMKGCHLPLLYIGLECGLTTNFKLADKFFLQAKAIAPSDPFVIHEMGVVAFQNLDFEEAEKLFEEALEKIEKINETIMSSKWEPLYNNLGHTCRKLKKYDKALEYFYKAMALVPHNPSTYASVGFVQALTARFAEACETFHKSLMLRRDDAFSTTMLTYVMEQLGHEPFPSEDDDSTLKAPTSTTAATPVLCITDAESENGSFPGSACPSRSAFEEMDVTDASMTENTS